MLSKLHVLLVEDDEADALLIVRQIRKAGYDITFDRVAAAATLLAALDARAWDVVISDVSMPGFSAMGALALCRDVGYDGPFIAVSGVITEEMAVALLKEGAHDFVLKTNLARLMPAIEREMREARVRRARTLAEEARRISEERYALAGRGTNDGLWDWDLSKGRIYFSPRWKEMLGLEEHQVGDQPEEWFGRIHPDDEPAVRAELDAHLARERPHFAAECRMQDGAGTWRWMLMRGVAILGADGLPSRIAGSLTDNTSYKRVEDRLRKTNAELENALAAKSRFLASASHDLRQPFQAMRLYHHMLASRLTEPVAQRMCAGLDTAMSAGEMLLNALLEVSTLDAGVVPVKEQEFRALEAAAAVVREFEPQAEARNIRLRLAGADDLIRSDPVLFGRILRNLVSNAIRYTPEGGHVLVACRRRGSATLALEVWDNGVGIPLEMQESVFEDFVQIGNQERDRRSGLGLGLAIVRRMANLLGCGLSLRSLPGKGSVFTVTFNRVVTVEAANVVRLPQTAPSPRPLNALRALLIEDDMMQLEVLQMIVEDWGFETLTAATSDEAFAIAATAPPDLIISDFRLPGDFTGAQVVARIAREAGRDIPTIIVTGDTAPDRIKEATAAGYLLMHKPYGPLELKALVDLALGKRGASVAGAVR